MESKMQELPPLYSFNVMSCIPRVLPGHFWSTVEHVDHTQIHIFQHTVQQRLHMVHIHGLMFTRC